MDLALFSHYKHNKPLLIDWHLFVEELIILTPRGVDFTTIPVTESCASQSRNCIYDYYESKIKRQLVINQVSAQQSILTEIITYRKWFINPNPEVKDFAQNEDWTPVLSQML